MNSIGYRILLVLGLWMMIHPTVKANDTELRFERFKFNDKLPSNSVNRIYHDRDGYLWFGTRDGLSRFDGYDTKVFRSSALTPGKMASNEIQYIAEDNHNRLWIGTFEGVNIIDKKNFSIKTLVNPYISKERINSIMLDSKGMMWVGTTNFGVVRINPETEEFVRYSADSDSPIKLKGNTVTHIFEDSAGTIWLTMWSAGLSRINIERATIDHAPQIGSKNNPFRFFEDKDHNYWVCTWGDGVFHLQLDGRNQMVIQPFKYSSKSERRIDDIVYSIEQDKQNRIWLVTFTGLDLLEKEEDGSFTVHDTRSLFDRSATQLFHSISKDRRDNLWLGSVGEGVFQMDFNKLPIRNFTLPEITRLGAQPYVTRLTQTNSGEILVVINRIGLFHFDRASGEVLRPTDPVLRSINSVNALITHRQSGEIWVADEGKEMYHTFRMRGRDQLDFVSTVSLPRVAQINENSISSFHEDGEGNMWIGTNNGLFLKKIGEDVELITDQMRYINDIDIDIRGQIWVGTEKSGLFKLTSDLKGGYKVAEVPLHIKDYESLSVQSILCRKGGEVYVATKEGGLYFIEHKKNVAVEISAQYGISEEGFLDIIEDNTGNIWLTTLKRIIRYNPETHASIYYSTSDGIIVSAFFKNAVLKLRSGEILFGGNNGICAFSPELQTASSTATSISVTISDILIQNKSLFDYAENEHFDPEKNSVLLRHNENSLSLEFSALDYSSASKIQYAYRMAGVDKAWNYVGNNRRFVNYSNLSPGTYTFQVKASNENGVWSERVTSLRVKVKPPYYASWWAYLIYVILASAITYIIFNTIANRIRLRNELKISHIEKEKTEELTQIKLRYFTNISHELLTPLTIIMLQIDSLQKKVSEHSVTFDIMKENVLRLKRLIKQILVFRKTESGNMKLRVINSDIVAFVKNICQSSFSPQVTEKEINFSVDIEYDSYLAYFDPDKLDKIVYNLLSNAFKFTPKGGSIALKMSFVPRNNDVIMRLSVSDTGTGISEQDLPNIFRRFYISSTADQSQSHGIGLSLTHDLLEIHHGKIQVVSQVGEGSVFTIEIPVSESSYSEEEKMTEDDKELEAAELIELGNEVRQSEATTEDEEEDQSFNLLVVEDNKGLNKLIAEHFADKYKVFTAENGLQALQLLNEKEIDLIISDVMMPEMDGLTFCKIVKNDVNTSHINVLMLTAKNSAEDRIDCYNAGADAFISKPFELAVLNARVRNLMGKRKQNAESFKHGHEINISSMEYNSVDEVFLKLAVSKVEERLADESFDFDQFAADINTSKSTLHRKLKSLTGLSPGEFIRNVRMKHALQMLSNNMGNISEIAYAVGFNDPKYFSRCFKAEFGSTPKEWMEKNKRKPQV